MSDIVHCNSLPIANMQEMQQAGTELAISKIAGAKNPAEGLAVMMICYQQGMSLLDFQANFHLMDGQISKRTDAMIAEMLRLGGEIKTLQRDHIASSLLLKFKDNEYTSTLTWEDAKEEPFIYHGGVKKQFEQLTLPWEQRDVKYKYRTKRSIMQMLWARAVSDGVRTVCPQACNGFYPPEVVEDFTQDQKTVQEIDHAEAAKRVQDQAEEVDYTRCPIEYGGQPPNTYDWEQFADDDLLSIVKGSIKDDRITVGHIENIEAILKERKEG